MVLTFSHSLNHKNTAYELFFDNGPFAILPMQKENGNNMSSIVWTNSNDYLDALNEINKEKLITELNKIVEPYIGKIKKIFNIQLFPLSAHINEMFYSNRNIYIGDSAHSVHPIAGQGWNLGMKDVEELSKLAKKFRTFGIEVGNNLFCKKYHNSRYFDAFRLFQITDKLDSLFQNKSFLVSSF